MLQYAFRGGRRYWTILAIGALLVLVGLAAYLRQLSEGLGITGMSRDVSWGLYIAQFTFLVGVAASAVMVVLPYYLHNYKVFGRMVILGEFLAVSAVLMCMLFVFVDMGQPARVLNMVLHPSPRSVMFWDLLVLTGYLLLNAIIGSVTLEAERNSAPPPRWIRPLIILSIPWAVSIHTVTAFLYAGLEARPFWMTAILAPRFLASAFSSGPALLILLAFILRRVAKYDVGKEPIQKLALIVTYAMCINVFFILMELFTAIYSNVPEDLMHFEYLFFGLQGKEALVPWMWTSVSMAVLTLILLINPKTRGRESILAVACVLVFLSIWIDKGMGMVVTGFVPSTLGKVQEYFPTATEIFITLAIYAIGTFLVTIFYKITLSVRKSIV